MIPVARFLACLGLHEHAKPICFCRCPQGLQFNRFKTRGEGLIQLEFREGLYRTAEGQLWIDDATDGEIPSAAELKPHAPTVGHFLDGWERARRFELSFADSDALSFIEIIDIGEWVSIEFEQRVYRGDDGRFIIEEIRDGRAVREVFPLFAEREIQASIDEYNSGRADGLS